MNSLPFDRPGRSWRGNLHTRSDQSDQSDGSLSPAATVQYYRSAGYDLLALTDPQCARRRRVRGHGPPGRHARTFRPDVATRSSGWAIGGWAIPFGNLVTP